MSHAVLVFSVFAILLLLPCPLNLFLIPRVRRTWNIVRWFHILRMSQYTTLSLGISLPQSVHLTIHVHVSKLFPILFKSCLLRIRILRSFGRPSIPSKGRRKLRIRPQRAPLDSSLVLVLIFFKGQHSPRLDLESLAN